MLIRACDFELNLQYIRSAALNCRYDKNKKAVLSQGNRAMQRIFVYTHDSWLLLFYKFTFTA